MGSRWPARMSRIVCRFSRRILIAWHDRLTDGTWMNPQPKSASIQGTCASMRDPAAEPVRHAVMYQNWCDLTFLHWRYPLDVVRKHVPPPPEGEDFEGTPWIGITPFFLRGLRPPGFPSLPWISNFPETNCRTYVRGPDGHSGIWFFSLDAARLAAVAGARVTYGLPYAWSRMEVTRSGSQIVYHSARTGPLPTASTDIIVEPGATIEAQPLERF